MEFRLLGPVELWADDRRCELGTAKERLVLAILLLNPGQLVTTEALIDHVWDTGPPAKPRPSLYSYVTRLRDRLAQTGGEVELPSRSGGYVLEVDETTIDVHRFQLLRTQARAIAQSGDDEHAIELYREASKLWRGEPLADLSGEWVLRTRRFIEDQLLAATFERVDLELQRGGHSDLVGELSTLAARYPYEEQLIERLMRVLYGCGRQAEALQVYRRTRARLLDEIGTEPDPRLRKLHERIVQGDRSLLYVQATRLDEGPPNTLPRDIQLTGRETDLRRLLEGLPHQSPPRKPAGPVVNVITIDGMPGVGKTAVAVHLAHELAQYYPDAQLFLDLHAHDKGMEPVDPATALGTLLRSLGVPHGRIPQTLDDRTALWRAQLARSRALVVLDDAAESDQVLPLLPGSPGCLTIVTSRRRLVGLDDVRSHSLDILPHRDAAALFTNIVGPGRPMNDKDLAAVVQRCGRLPLGISIAGSRLRHHSAWTLADLLARLEHDNRRLDELRAADRAVATVFEISYRELSARQSAAFRLLGLHPGPTFTAHAAASLIRAEAAETESILDDLHERHLLNELERGRFSFHDLLQDYALRLAVLETSDQERRDAIRRILDFYVAGADRADRLLYPQRRRLNIAEMHPAPSLPDLTTKPLAQRWLTTEFDNLLSVASYAGQHGWPTHVAHFALVLAAHLESRGYWTEAAALHLRASAAWAEIGDQAGMARALADLSLVQFRSGQYDGALEQAEEALGIHRSMADQAGEAEMLDHIGVIRWHQSRFTEALANCRAALRIWQSLNDRPGIARGLDHAAIYLEYLGRYREASSNRQRALIIYAQVGDLHGQQMALNNMGDLQLRLGDVESALDYYRRAAAATSEMGRQHEAIWMGNMASINKHTKRFDDALEGYRDALRIHQELGDPRGQIETLIGIGETFQCLGKYSEALIHYEKARSISRDISERYEETKALRCIGSALLSFGRYPAALDHFKQALDLANQIGELFEKAKALEGIGSARFYLNDQTHARFWKQAYSLYKRLGTKEASVVQSYLLESDDTAPQ